MALTVSVGRQEGHPACERSESIGSALHVLRVPISITAATGRTGS